MELDRAQQMEAPPMSKKEKGKLAKLEKKNEAKKMAALQLNIEEEEEVDPLAGNYGDVVLENLQSKEKSGRVWSQVGDLSGDQVGQTVLERGRVHTVRGKGSLAFLVVRQAGHTVQCVVLVKDNVVSKGMVKFVTKLNKESIVDVEGVVMEPTNPVDMFEPSIKLLTGHVCISCV